MESSYRIWNELGLPPVKQTPPWHGYTLGDWSDSWQRFADRTARGDWEENGKETLARQRRGLEAETSVKRVEGDPVQQEIAKASRHVRGDIHPAGEEG
jgi:4-hydroxy-3-polyprenylbenzoate decarboxylase